MIEKNKRKKYMTIILIMATIFFIVSIIAILIMYKNNKPVFSFLHNTNTENIVIDKEGNTIDDNIIGILNIPKINLNTNVREGTDLSTLDIGVGHFIGTSYNKGNVGIAGHNSGNKKDFFKNLNKLELGDTIIYNNNFCERTYIITLIKEISETDWSYLQPSEDNIITLITCVKGKKQLRLMVQAKELI